MCVLKRWLIGYPTHAVLLAPADMRCSAAFLDWCHIAVRGCEAPGIRSLWGFPATERLTGMSNIWGSTSFFLAKKKHAPIWHTIYQYLTNWFWNMDLATLLMFHKQMESGHPRSFAIPSISTLEPKKIIVHQPVPMISHFHWSKKISQVLRGHWQRGHRCQVLLGSAEPPLILSLPSYWVAALTLKTRHVWVSGLSQPNV